MADLRTMNNQKQNKTDSMANAVMMNPIIRKMDKKTKEEAASNNCATYKGVGTKTLFFLILTAIGTGLFFLLHHILVDNISPSQVITFDMDSYTVHTSLPELGIVCGALLIDIVFPFIVWFIKSTAPIVGSIYALAQGVFVGYVTITIPTEYRWLSVLALVLTFAIVATMLILYTTRIIKVTAKFRKFMFILFGSIIIGSILLIVMHFIPGLNIVAMGIDGILANPVVSIVSSIVFIIIAAIFLVADFNGIEECVERKMDKSYEWMAAFGLAYTIIYLYFKILNLLVQIFVRNSD